jgi:hypothetical protein
MGMISLAANLSLNRVTKCSIESNLSFRRCGVAERGTCVGGGAALRELRHGVRQLLQHARVPAVLHQLHPQAQPAAGARPAAGGAAGRPRRSAGRAAVAGAQRRGGGRADAAAVRRLPARPGRARRRGDAMMRRAPGTRSARAPPSR